MGILIGKMKGKVWPLYLIGTLMAISISVHMYLYYTNVNEVAYVYNVSMGGEFFPAVGVHNIGSLCCLRKLNSVSGIRGLELKMKLDCLPFSIPLNKEVVVERYLNDSIVVVQAPREDSWTRTSSNPSNTIRLFLNKESVHKVQNN